jgi:uncharacterized protein (DUF1501 family)
LDTRHAPLLKQVDEAMTAFYQATVELGVANQVTSFTASDFGRTLTSNGDGSDHGRGSHHWAGGRRSQRRRVLRHTTASECGRHIGPRRIDGT